MSRTLILGGGFGGLTVATELRRSLGDQHEIIVIDRREHFVMGLRKLWVMVGQGSFEEGRRHREQLNAKGIRFIREDIVAIDPAKRHVETDGQALDADHLVIALGAEPRADLVDGLAEHAHNLYDADAIPALADEVSRFTGGRIAVVIAGVPYKCPPAPYEASMLLDAHLRERGLRERTELVVATVQPMLLPNAGAEGSAWLGEQLSQRKISWHVGRKVQGVEAGRLIFDDGELEVDLLIGVPPHRPPAVVKASGLTGPGEWVQVDPETLETGHGGVYAIGDATQIKLANGLPLPKAGLFAELEGERVAAAIAAKVRGEEQPPLFDGRGFCFIEMGSSNATLVKGDFYARPEPRIEVQEASPAHMAEKHRFEADRLERWFGEAVG